MKRSAGIEMRSDAPLGSFGGTAPLRSLGTAVLAGAAMFVIAASVPGPVTDDLQVATFATNRLLSSTEKAKLQTSAEVQNFVGWIASTSDNDGLEFFVIDKKNATAHAYDAEQQLRASTPVLIGSAIGDETVTGIGDRPLALVQANERTTPAGRFIAEQGTNAQGEPVVWIDYDAAVSMHSVRATNASEHRLERLASPDAEDRRISYGCVNFPAAFFKAEVLPRLMSRKALVYVLPETKPISRVFGLKAASSFAPAARVDSHTVTEGFTPAMPTGIGVTATDGVGRIRN